MLTDGRWTKSDSIHPEHISGELKIGSSEVEVLFVCVGVLRPGQPSGVMSSAVSLPNHTFTGQA